MAEESLPQGRGDSQNTNTNNSVGSDRGALGSDSEEECSEGPREQALEVRQLSRSQETATSVVVNVAYDLWGDFVLFFLLLLFLVLLF